MEMSSPRLTALPLGTGAEVKGLDPEDGVAEDDGDAVLEAAKRLGKAGLVDR